MILLDITVWPVMVELGACLTVELREAQGPEICGTFLLPGAIPALGDYCSSGMAWVRLQNITSVVDDQVRTAGGGTCYEAINKTVEVGVIRCAPVGASMHDAPTVEQWMEATAVALSDMAAIRRAISCCSKGLALGVYQPLGPDGDCVGGFWTATFDG